MGAAADRARDQARDQALREVEHEIVRLVRRIRRSLGARAAEVDPGLTASSYPLLVALVDLGPHRAADLVDVFALDKGSVSRAVHQLLELGLIERVPDPRDGRASILSATPRAVERIAATKESRHQEIGARLADWGDEAIVELGRGLARFNAAVTD